MSCNGLVSVASQEVEFLLIIEDWQHALIFSEEYIYIYKDKTHQQGSGKMTSLQNSQSSQLGDGFNAGRV